MVGATRATGSAGEAPRAGGLGRFDVYLFDAGGIFVLPDPTVLSPLLAYYGGSTRLDDYVRAHYAGMAVKARGGHVERDWGSYNLEYVRRVGVHEDATEIAAHVLGRTRNAWTWRWPIADSVETLRALAVRKVPLGVVSNASGQIEQVLRDSAVCQIGEGPGVPVEVIIDSEVVGVMKPDPAIFGFALAHFPGVARERVAYIGDSVTMDVGGARAAGLHPILLDPFDDHPDAEFERIHRLSELLASA
jgi:putative hydrolase of the HAD superfamily